MIDLLVAYVAIFALVKGWGMARQLLAGGVR